MEDLKKRVILALGFSLIYSLFIFLFVGWRTDHNVFLIIVNLSAIIHRKTYQLTLAWSAFIIFWIIYDSMRIYPNYLFNDVHVLEPYEIELWLFGFYDEGRKIIPCEWFLSQTNDFLSIFAGISYLLWVPGPMIYAYYLSRKEPSKMVRFSYAFLLTNFVGFFVYYMYPAAPPWYHLNFGDATDFTIPGNEGLLSEFDRIIGIPIFNGIYAKNANVFAAIPSLHASYPVISLFFAIKYKSKFFTGFFIALTIGVWFAAVYSQHHYIIDLLLGMLCAIMAYFLMKKIVLFNWFIKLENWFVKELDPNSN